MSPLYSLGLLAAFILASVNSGARSTREGHDDVASCRNLATELTVQMTAGGGFTATNKTTCSFNAAAKRSTCMTRYSDSQGTTLESTTTSTYNSVADVVDEIAVSPPLSYVLSSAGTQTGSRGKSSGSVTNTFDSNRRIVKTVNTSGNGESTTTYTAWDAAGRPTRASDVGKGFSNTRAISYDDAARTRTTVVNGGPLRTVETLSADGNQIATLTTSGGATLATKATVTITASQSVCK